MLSDFATTYGPNGEDDLIMLGIEYDLSTTVDQLAGIGVTEGDWITGTSYPLINLESDTTVIAYEVFGYPTTSVF